MIPYIFPYRATSKSAIAISEAMDCYRINRTNSQFTYADNKAVINWGWGDALPEEVARCKVINKPTAVSNAISKIKSFELFIANRVRCPDYTTDINTAKQWINQGYSVFCRTENEGSDGSGIVFAHEISQLVRARLYTKNITNSKEFRVHVVGDAIISYQKKVHSDRLSASTIRTTSNGWNFEVVEERDAPSVLDDESIAAVKALGLDFGGVDIIIANDAKAYVLEVNTAPHLTPYSARKMAEALKEYIG